MKTYFLFGTDATNIYKYDGINAVVEAYEANEITFNTFVFIDGEAPPQQLLMEYKGWQDYTVITEEEYNLL